VTRPVAPTVIKCPYCLSPIAFNPAEVYIPRAQGGFERFDLRTEPHPDRREDILRTAWQRCGYQVDGQNRHHVPVPYLTHGTPLTVALVGRSGTGKSNLLAAMLAELEGSLPAQLQLSFGAVNQQLHDRARKRLLEPFSQGEVLGHTQPAGNAVEFLDALLVKVDGAQRPVGFFDVAGEDLLRTDRAMRFLVGVDAFIFVVDPVQALQLPQLDRLPGRPAGGERSLGDPTFGAVLDRLPRTGRFVTAPMAVVLTKADLVRFDSPVDRWLHRPLAVPLDPAEMEAEGRDVYAFVTKYGGGAWLRPVQESQRCTLHFASATGSAPRDGRYPAGAHSRRAVNPLLAVFAMCGLLGPRLADAVGT